MPSRLLNGGIVGPFAQEVDSGIWGIDSASITGPVYTVSINGTNFNEGSVISVSVSVNNLPSSVIIPWTLTGAEIGDVAIASGGAITGSEPITGTVAITPGSVSTLSLTISEDLITEGTETWVFSLGAYDSDNNPTRLENQFFEITVQDTSIFQQIRIDSIKKVSDNSEADTDVIEGYTLKEGIEYYVLVESINHANTAINWSISPGTDFAVTSGTANTLVSVTTSGTDEIYTWSIPITPAADYTTEEDTESFSFIIRLSTDINISDSINFNISDTAIDPISIKTPLNSNYNEGDFLDTTILIEDSRDGTFSSANSTIYYSVESANGDIASTADFNSPSGSLVNSNTVALESGQTLWEFSTSSLIGPKVDFTTEGTLTYYLKWYRQPNQVDEITEVSQSFNVIDTSQDLVLELTQSFASSNTITVAEGSIIDFELELNYDETVSIASNTAFTQTDAVNPLTQGTTVINMTDLGTRVAGAAEAPWVEGQTVYKRGLQLIAVEDATTEANTDVVFDIQIQGGVYQQLNVTITDNGLPETHDYLDQYPYIPFNVADTGTLGQEEDEPIIDSSIVRHAIAEPFSQINTYLNNFGISTTFTTDSAVYDTVFANTGVVSVLDEVDGFYKFVIGRDGKYRIRCEGGDGGGNYPWYGRRGIIEANFFFKKDEELYIVVGRRGGHSYGIDGSNTHIVTAGGGGMSAVFKYLVTPSYLVAEDEVEPLIVAGGGGGITYPQTGAPTTRNNADAIIDVSSSARTNGFPAGDGVGTYASGTSLGGAFGQRPSTVTDSAATTAGYGRPGSGFFSAQYSTDRRFLTGNGIRLTTTVGLGEGVLPMVGGTRSLANFATSSHNNGLISIGGFGGGAGATSNFDTGANRAHFRGAGGGGGYSGGGSGCGSGSADGSWAGGGSCFYSTKGALNFTSLLPATTIQRSGRVTIELLEPGTY